MALSSALGYHAATAVRVDRSEAGQTSTSVDNASGDESVTVMIAEPKGSLIEDTPSDTFKHLQHELIRALDIPSGPVP